MDKYVERTRGCITSSKLKEFCRCGFCFEKKYVQEVPEPKDQFDKEYFLIGRAFDDLVTNGKESFDETYDVVSRRGKDKDDGKTQLTFSMAKTVDRLHEGFKSNPLFWQEKKKETVVVDYLGFKISGEFDDVNHDLRQIRDIKTTANLANFTPDMYIWQMAFYHLIADIAFGAPYSVGLEVVDKHDVMAHSRYFEFTVQTLRREMKWIIDALMQYKEYLDTGIYPLPKHWKDYLQCPYYGVDGHGIQTDPEYI